MKEKPDGSREIIGETYHEYRRQLMLDRQEGLTKTYNRFHDPDETAADIIKLRELHVEMDQAVAAAYGWVDLALGHAFHETPQGLRYTISESARREVLGRLLALNHERYEAEVKAGLHDAKRKKEERRKEKAGPPGKRIEKRWWAVVVVLSTRRAWRLKTVMEEIKGITQKRCSVEDGPG